jgi:hypothetical protein
VQVAGGRRGEAHADWRIWAHQTMLTGEREAHHLRQSTSSVVPRSECNEESGFPRLTRKNPDPSLRSG